MNDAVVASLRPTRRETRTMEVSAPYATFAAGHEPLDARLSRFVWFHMNNAVSEPDPRAFVLKLRTGRVSREILGHYQSFHPGDGATLERVMRIASEAADFLDSFPYRAPGAIRP